MAPPAPPRAHPPPPPGADNILTIPNDPREYCYMVLPNHMRCVLVRDSCSHKMCISLGVEAAGYFSDPDDALGLAQLLGHSLMCNPTFSNFQKLLSEHNGSFRSMILAERASFCADASTCVFNDIVAGFARFISEPSFSCPSNQTHAGSYNNDKPSDLDNLQRHLTNKDHPYHKFRAGNVWLALENLKAKGPEAALLLRKFYESHYSADMMSLVIYGSDSLDHMKELAIKNFSSFRNSETKPYTQLMNLCTYENCQILVKVPSMDGSKALRVQWLIECSTKKETDAIKYILHVLNYNNEGSLFYALENVKKWSSNAHAHETDPHSEFTFLSLDITLTDEGIVHYKDVCGLVFRYIMMLKAFKTRRYIFDELKRVSMEELRCGEVLNPIEYAIEVASNILTLPERYCLIGSLPMEYSEDHIRNVQNSLSSERVRIFLVGEFEGKTNMVEPVYNTSYSMESVEGVIQEWTKSAPKVELYLPSAEKAKKAANEPDWIKNAPKVEIYLLRTEKAKKGVHEQPSSLPQGTQPAASLPQGTQPAANVCIIFDKRMEEHEHVDAEEKHQECPGRIQAIYARLQADGLLNRCSVFHSQDAKPSQILQAHSDDHLLHIMKGEISNTDMYFGEGSLNAILLAAGGAVKACDMVATGKFQHSFAVVRPPGHHASSDVASGFCYLNNVAIAAKHLQKEYNFKKILIFDIDIHFGDGTSSIFKEDSSVLYVSTHFDDFPFGPELLETEIGEGDGTGYNCNVVWPKPVNDDDLCVVVDHLVLPMAQDYQPDIILVSAGFDAALGETYGHYVTPAGYAAVIAKLLQLEKPLVLVLEGGYNTDVLGNCCSSCIKVLAGDTSMINDKNEYTPLKSTWISVVKLKKLLHPYYPSLTAKIPEEVISRCVRTHPKPREVT